MNLGETFQTLFDRYVTACRAGDPEGCAALFTDNAEVVSPYGPTARGREAILATHREWVGGGVEGKEICVLSCGGEGDVAWCLAAYREGESIAQGTSLNVLERQADGSWLIRVSSLNARYDGAVLA